MARSEHQLPLQSLAVGMQSDQSLQLANQSAVITEG